MSIAARLKKVEALVLDRTCQECGAGNDAGAAPVRRRVPVEEVGKPCASCGVVPRVIRIRPIRLVTGTTACY